METLNSRFSLMTEIGRGKWSVVHKAYDALTSTEVAIKLERRGKSEMSVLMREAQILELLQGIEGVPLLIDKGSTSKYNFIAMELLEANFEELYLRSHLSPSNVLVRAGELLSILEGVHSKRIMHQDLKPKNIMASKAKTFLIDFGLASVVKPATKFKPREVLGTANFASISALLGAQQFPRDDLECLGYVIVWLLRGRLPWESYNSQGNLSGLRTMKFHSTVRGICQGCPEEMTHYFNYSRGLKDDAQPDYKFLRKLMSSAHHNISLSLTASPKLHAEPIRNSKREKPSGVQPRSHRSSSQVCQPGNPKAKITTSSDRELVPPRRSSEQGLTGNRRYRSDRELVVLQSNSSDREQAEPQRHSSDREILVPQRDSSDRERAVPQRDSSDKELAVPQLQEILTDISIISIRELLSQADLVSPHSPSMFAKLDNSCGVKSQDLNLDDARPPNRTVGYSDKLREAKQDPRWLSCKANLLTPENTDEVVRSRHVSFDFTNQTGMPHTADLEALTTDRSRQRPEVTQKLRRHLKGIKRQTSPSNCIVA
jgi:serine/threonine protein kinase